MTILASENGKTVRIVKSMVTDSFLEFVGFGSSSGNLKKQRQRMKRFASRHNIDISKYPNNNIPKASGV